MREFSELDYVLKQLKKGVPILDCSDWKVNNKMYGGAAGRKLGLTSSVGHDYMLKFPTSFKGRDLKNVEVSYGNNSLAEFVGSHIFEEIGVGVHNTKLAWYKGKLVVLCEDFIGKEEDLVEFSKLKNSSICEHEDTCNANSMDIWKVIYFIENTDWLVDIRDHLLQLFYDMFVIDYLNGNQDRTLNDFGLIRDKRIDKFYVAPVYDNGSCLFFKYSKEQIKECLNNTQVFISKMDSVTSRFTESGHNINPLKFMNTHFDLFKESIKKVLNANIREKLLYIFGYFKELDDFELYSVFYTEIYEYRLARLKELYDTKSNR